MRKLPFYMGIGMISIQCIIAGIYLISQVTITSSTLNFWILALTVVPINIASMFLLVYGIVSDEK